MSFRRAVAVLCVGLSLLGFAACGSNSVASNTPIATNTPSVTATPKIAHAGQASDQLMAGLKAKGLPIGASFTFTADNDQNKLLGRPGQYTGKVNWNDMRIQTSDTGPDISASDGGSIETFATADDATRRFTYVSNIAKTGGPFAEYDYVDGTALLRVSGQLTPAQAKAYADAFTALP